MVTKFPKEKEEGVESFLSKTHRNNNAENGFTKAAF